MSYRNEWTLKWFGSFPLIPFCHSESHSVHFYLENKIQSLRSICGYQNWWHNIHKQQTYLKTLKLKRPKKGIFYQKVERGWQRMAGVHVRPVDHIHSPLPSFGLLLTLAYYHLYLSTNKHILASLPLHYNQSKFKIPPFTLTLPTLVSCTSRWTKYIFSKFSVDLHLYYCDIYYYFVYKNVRSLLLPLYSWCCMLICQQNINWEF